MSALTEGLKQLTDVANPRVLKTLRDAGAASPKAPLGLAKAFPWLIGRGPSLGIVSQMNAVVLGHKIALYDRNGSVSWKELDLLANRAANALRDLGLRGNDRVALLLRNGREMVTVALGAQKLGIVACPLNTWAKPKELRSLLEQSDPKVLVYDTAHSEQLEKCDTDGIEMFFVGDSAAALDGSGPLDEILERNADTPPPPFTRDRGSAKIVIHTSGTTGTPKGAQRNASAAGMGALANLISVVPYRRDDIVFCPAPMFHSFGLFTFVISAGLGTTMVLPEKFDPEDSLRMIQEHGATAASFVPVMIKRIVSLPDEVKSRYDLSSLRVVMASGSAMSPELRAAAADVFGEVLYDLYGSTEIGWVTIATPEAMKSRPKTVGRPVPGIDVVVFSDGQRVGANETGELYIKSDTLFEGYTSGDAKEERDGYMSIGDVGYIDDEGYLFIEGRADDMVIVGGENVYPIEIEEVIESIDGVQEAAVLGVTDEEYGEVLAAFIVGSASEDEVAKTCKSELASFKVPRRIEKVDELPRTSTGKVLKRQLVADLQGAGPLEDA
ncbi:MAG TPA: AMP-binding protein [Actinomycetota bacterium]|nr:AMP-binding protein [Actinomycetota bacterium]